MLWCLHNHNYGICIENTEKKKKHLNFPQKLVSKNLFSVTMGNMLTYGLGKIFGGKFSSLKNQYKVGEG